MWFYVVLFALALCVKMYKKDVFKFVVPSEDNKDIHNPLWTMRFVFIFALMYLHINTENAKWKWALFCAHCLAGSVNMFITVFRTPELGQAHSMILVGAGLIFGRIMSPVIDPWVSLTSLIACCGITQNKRDSILYATTAACGYIFIIGTCSLPPLMDICLFGLVALIRCVSLIEHEGSTSPLPVVLSLWNVLYIVNIPMENPDALDAEDTVFILCLTAIVFLVQWTIAMWVRESGAASYVLGAFIYDVLIIMCKDISTEMIIVGWVTIIMSAYAYSTFPSSQNLPPREPSVPPLPDDAVPPLPPESPKTKHEDSKPSAPLDLPDPPSEAPVQGEIV